jgi:hypothetical protein
MSARASRALTAASDVKRDVKRKDHHQDQLEASLRRPWSRDAPLYSSIFRFDDQMFVTPHLYATPGNFINWPDKATVIPANRFPDVAATAARLFAEAATELASIRARRRL